MMMMFMTSAKIAMIHFIGGPQANFSLWGIFTGLEADQTNWKFM